MDDLFHAPATTAPAPQGSYVAGFWKSPEAFKAAARAAREAGYAQLQAYMPYPLHGFDDILGLQRSWIGRPVFAICCVGFLLAFGMCSYHMVDDFPAIYGGKPYATWQLFVVVTLETGLLFGALANLLLCFHTCRLLPDPTFTPMHERLSDDTFAIAVPVSAQHSAAQLRSFFEGLHAEDIRVHLEPASAAVAAPAAEASHV
jgi:hypothetical protein